MDSIESRIGGIRNILKGLSTEESLQVISRLFPDETSYSSAFGYEDQVIVEMISRLKLNIEVFTLDTGRLFPETYELIDRTRSKYKLKIKTYYPNTEAVESITSEKGMHSFYESVDNRKECCFIRKIEPLQRALKDAKIWVTGVRASQSTNRGQFELVEWDESNQVIKFNPLLRWTQEDLDAHIKKRDVPYNVLHKRGFVSIGCAPCTRAIESGENIRAGRWWWESSQKECGLHQIKMGK